MIDSESAVSFPSSTNVTSLRNDLVEVNREFKSVEASMNRAALVGSQFGKVMSTAFTGMALQGRSFNDVLRTVGLSLSKLALDASFKSMGSALARAVVQSTSSMGGSSVAFAKGGLLSAGTPVPFASGGIVSSPVMFPLGRGAGIAGERGAEAILPLARGPDGRLGVAASGAGGNISVTFNVTTPDAESFRRSENQLAALLARTVGRGHRNL
jgi:phage-related minor tail protein